VAEGCLDAHFLRKGNERWAMNPENYSKCVHNPKSQELQAQFEKAWAEKVAPEPALADSKEADGPS